MKVGDRIRMRKGTKDIHPGGQRHSHNFCGARSPFSHRLEAHQHTYFLEYAVSGEHDSIVPHIAHNG